MCERERRSAGAHENTSAARQSKPYVHQYGPSESGTKYRCDKKHVLGWKPALLHTGLMLEPFGAAKNISNQPGFCQEQLQTHRDHQCIWSLDPQNLLTLVYRYRPPSKEASDRTAKLSPEQVCYVGLESLIRNRKCKSHVHWLVQCRKLEGLLEAPQAPHADHGAWADPWPLTTLLELVTPGGGGGSLAFLPSHWKSSPPEVFLSRVYVTKKRHEMLLCCGRPGPLGDILSFVRKTNWEKLT